MSKHALLALLVTTALTVAPSPAIAASYAPNGSNTCLSTELTVATAAGTGIGANTLTATVVGLGTAGQRVSRLHLDLEVQERTAVAWVRFVTPGHAETYANIPGPRLHRTWVLHEDAGPIDALLAGHVQMRVYAKFTGVCPGESLGPPLLYGLSPPMLGGPAAS
jgi:hypothetical protein